MGRIYDYDSYSSKKNKFFNTQMSFSKEFAYVDIEILNKPKELLDYEDVECEIDYQVSVRSNETGVEGFDFNVSLIELELKKSGTDDEIEFDLNPGKNFPSSSLNYVKGQSLIPSDPTRILIDMNNSTMPKDFFVEVTFGED